MSLEPIQQLQNLLGQAKNILIFLPENPGSDAISAGWASCFFLEKMGISSTLVLRDEYNSAEKFYFLPRPQNIIDNVSGTRDFILSFNTKYNKILKVKTEQLGEEMQIVITPQKGAIDPRDFSFVPAKFKFDLIITLDSPDKEAMGKNFEENPDIFYEVPVVNIDHHADNENFGQINFVMLTASSTSEVLYEMMEKINPALLDDKIASCLLSGIISATESFQKKNTTPRSMEIASKLMEKGADQQKIIRWLYKTQPLHILKLWGRVMARMNWDEEKKLAWSLVGIEDFVQSRSTANDIPLVLEKIRDNYSEGKIFLVLYNEKENIVAGLAKFVSTEAAKKFAVSIGAEARNESVSFKITDKNIIEAEKEVLEKLACE
jgi:nanoRNase/pAp phosphatase (c-di-AMP/oligoRNAs hydrolase)